MFLPLYRRRAGTSVPLPTPAAGLVLSIGGLLAAAALLAWFQPDSGSLAGFEHARTFAIPAIPRNLSGVTYSPETRTLFLVSNGPAKLYEATRDGRLLRTIALVGFYDTEDIAFIGKQTFAVVEERRRRISLFRIGPATRSVRYAACRHITVAPASDRNTGLEGLTWDPGTRTLLAAHENRPRTIFAIPLGRPGRAFQIEPLRNLPWLRLGDYAGIHFLPAAGRLLILSRTSGKIKDFTLDGLEKGSLNLLRVIPGLSRAEGLTVVPDGELYVCSEPNRIDVFRKSEDLPTSHHDPS